MLINLTSTEEGPLLINPKHIIVAQWNKEIKATDLVLIQASEKFSVTETPAKINELIRASKC